MHLRTGQVLGHPAAGEWRTVHAPVGEPAVFYKDSEVGTTFVHNLLQAGIAVAAAPR